MELVQTLVNAFVVGAVGTVLALMFTGLRRDFASLRREFASLRTELKGDIAELRAEMHEEIRGVRSDLTQVALAVGATRRAQAD